MRLPRDTAVHPEQGAALILTVLVLAVMVILVVQFTFSVRVEAQIVQNPEDDTALEVAARSALPVLEALFADVYPGQSPAQWYRRWRMLYLAGAEMFGLRDGAEWYVSHYRFEPRGSSQELTREGDEHAWEHGTPRGELVG